jgi:hypothetical protein
VSNATLAAGSNSKNGKSFVTISKGKELKNLNVACLTADRNES